MSRSGADLALLLLGGFRTLVDAATAELSDRGYEDVRPVHDFAIRAIAAGADSASELARRLSITESTVKVHVKTILRKVKVRNRTQAAVWAMSHLVSMSAIAAAGFGLWDPNFMRHVVRIFMLGVLEV